MTNLSEQFLSRSVFFSCLPSLKKIDCVIFKISQASMWKLLIMQFAGSQIKTTENTGRGQSIIISRLKTAYLHSNWTSHDYFCFTATRISKYKIRKQREEKESAHPLFSSSVITKKGLFVCMLMWLCEASIVTKRLDRAKSQLSSLMGKIA